MLLLFFTLCFVFIHGAEDDAVLFAKAVAGIENVTLVEAALAGDASALYRIAKHRMAEAKDRSSRHVLDETAVAILHRLADDSIQPHIPSQVALGFAYYNVKQYDESLIYFTRAGESGPHQAALYNAGKIHAERSDWVPALAYMQSAITLESTHPDKVKETVSDASRQAYDILSENIAFQDEVQKLTIEQITDIFFYASPNDFPNNDKPSAALWKAALKSLWSFNQTASFTIDIDLLTASANNLRKLWETSSLSMSKLQVHLTLKTINRILGLLTAIDDAYLNMAAGYAEALAISPYCSQLMAASTIQDPFKCFNEAISNSFVYYRRSGDNESVQRIWNYAHAHPKAATLWTLFEQTPPVFVTTGSQKPWYNSDDEFRDFKMYLRLILSNCTVDLHRTNTIDGPMDIPVFRTVERRVGSPQQLQVSITGQPEPTRASFQPIVSAHVRSRVNNRSGRAELGPLFTLTGGWDETACASFPTLCQTLRELSSPNLVSLKIVRLSPGTTVLPHCGYTNNELLLYACLDGCTNLNTTVGGQSVQDFDAFGSGNRIILFNKGYEHSMVYEGLVDSYFIAIALSL